MLTLLQHMEAIYYQIIKQLFIIKVHIYLAKNDSKRSLFTGDRADAKFTSKTFALDLKVGHKIAINDSFSVEPNIGTTYRHISNPSYTENGAGALNIHSDKFNFS